MHFLNYFLIQKNKYLLNNSVVKRCLEFKERKLIAISRAYIEHIYHKIICSAVSQPLITIALTFIKTCLNSGSFNILGVMRMLTNLGIN